MTSEAMQAEQGGVAEQAIGPYLQAVRRHWRLVAFVTVLAVIVTAAAVQVIGTPYSASASIFVTPVPEGDAAFVGSGTVFDTGDPARTVQTAAALIDTPAAAASAAHTLGRPWTTQTVLQDTSVSPRGASSVLAVTAQAATARDAVRLANAFAQAAVGYRATIVQAQIAAAITQLEARLAAIRTASGSTSEADALATGLEQLRAVQGAGREPTLSVSQTAQSAARSGSSRALILILAIVGGFALASIAALGLDAFGGPVRDREEATRLYPVPVLAAIQEIPGRRGSMGIPPWTLPPAVFEQVRMLRVQLSMGNDIPTIMVTSAGAGDGKTTVAAALAASFSEAGKQVWLMDLDLRKPDLPRILSMEREVAEIDSSERAAGVPLNVEALPGVRLLPAPTPDIARFETVVKRLPLLLAQARKTAHVVIIDTAPIGEVSDSLRVVGLCDHVLLVVRPGHTDRRRLSLARDLLRRAGANLRGLVLVGKEIGLPRGADSYGYAMGQSMRNGAADPDSQSQIVSTSSGGRSELDVD